MPIVEFNASNPLVDGRQSERALAIRRGVVRLFREAAITVVAELPLASGRRADLVGLDGRGRFHIVEIKSSIGDFRADSKWPDYLAHCDCYYFATHPEVPQDIFPETEGLIVADSWGGEIVRESRDGKLAGATRKAMMLRFARAAAGRLERVIEHHEAAGLALPGDLADIVE
ncbi:MAG: MmcB family DNA repair protein [Pseudomonadota bacterium]|nr:MmcB family DNA repair protein [Pseudomonadota bacterium]